MLKEINAGLPGPSVEGNHARINSLEWSPSSVPQRPPDNAVLAPHMEQQLLDSLAFKLLECNLGPADDPMLLEASQPLEHESNAISTPLERSVGQGGPTPALVATGIPLDTGGGPTEDEAQQTMGDGPEPQAAMSPTDLNVAEDLAEWTQQAEAGILPQSAARTSIPTEATKLVSEGPLDADASSQVVQAFLRSITMPVHPAQASIAATPTPRTRRRGNAETSPLRRSRRIAAVAGRGSAQDKAQTLLMRKLGVITGREEISPKAREVYSRLFEHPLSRSHLTALATLFG